MLARNPSVHLYDFRLNKQPLDLSSISTWHSTTSLVGILLMSVEFFMNSDWNLIGIFPQKLNSVNNKTFRFYVYSTVVELCTDPAPFIISKIFRFRVSWS